MLLRYLIFAKVAGFYIILKVSIYTRCLGQIFKSTAKGKQRSARFTMATILQDGAVLLCYFYVTNKVLLSSACFRQIAVSKRGSWQKMRKGYSQREKMFILRILSTHFQSPVNKWITDTFFI